jgi:hypothetical protein
LASWLSRIFSRKAEPLHQATLIFNGWQTKCSHCGGNARAEEKFHERNYAGKPHGCGARFTAFTIIGHPTQAEISAHCQARQDIPYVSANELDSSLAKNTHC